MTRRGKVPQGAKDPTVIVTELPDEGMEAIMTPERPVFISLRCAPVYGPMHRSPGGSTLGVNPLPPDRKTCTFNCAHCPYGWTPSDALDCPESAWPSTGQVVDALERWFARAPRRDARIDRLRCQTVRKTR